MDLESLLPFSEQPATDPYSEPNESSPQLTTLFHQYPL
jgi:hypothetical protein